VLQVVQMVDLVVEPPEAFLLLIQPVLEVPELREKVTTAEKASFLLAILSRRLPLVVEEAQGHKPLRVRQEKAATAEADLRPAFLVQALPMPAAAAVVVTAPPLSAQAVLVEVETDSNPDKQAMALPAPSTQAAVAVETKPAVPAS
jgi:hypothetical protein